MAGAILSPIESVVLGAFSQSTGSILFDSVNGAGTAYAMAPDNAKARYALGGAVATGLGGLLGLLATVGFIWATRSDRARPKRLRTRRSRAR
jgi:hypothetical protein